jgi:cytochrome c oxidase assembly protein subunit 15
MAPGTQPEYLGAMAGAFEISSLLRTPGKHAVGFWLLALALIVLCMVTLGGLTRLTGSGLSITEWKPVTGTIPPLSNAAWSAEFAKYKHIPQYLRENSWMTLADFKAIYWWEWAHRLLGRLLAAAFAIPFVWFAWTGAIARRDWPRMLILFALGALQGFIGWWMVESGLETRVAVSQYRLAIHLGTAVLLLGALLWIGLEYLTGGPRRPSSSVVGAPAQIDQLSEGKSQARLAFGFVALVYLQLLLGAFVAGLHAGLIYNTWPLMDGRLVPEYAFFSRPWWINFFENAGLAQFDHRIVAYIVLGTAIVMWYRLRGLASEVRRSSTAVLHATFLQVILGVTTLLLQAPVLFSAAHQLLAAVLFCVALWNAFEVTDLEARTVYAASA